MGVFPTADNLHDYIDLFLKNCRKLIAAKFLPALKTNNVKP